MPIDPAPSYLLLFSNRVGPASDSVEGGLTHAVIVGPCLRIVIMLGFVVFGVAGDATFILLNCGLLMPALGLIFPALRYSLNGRPSEDCREGNHMRWHFQILPSSLEQRSMILYAQIDINRYRRRATGINGSFNVDVSVTNF